jgi:organic radical activating enzyme
MAHQITGGAIVSDTLEVDIVDQCNMSCRACSHLSPVAAKRTVSADDVRRDLERLAPCYHARTLRLLGGEPLLHRSLAQLAAAATSTGIADEICLVTNGILLPGASDEIWRSVQRIEVSIYPGRQWSMREMERVRAQAQQFGVIVELVEHDRFQETYLERANDDADLVRRIYRTCQLVHVWGCHNVREGWFYKCPQAHILPARIDANIAREGVDLSRSDLFTALAGYLEDERPLDACRFCLGSAGKAFEHEEIVRSDAMRSTSSISSCSSIWRRKTGLRSRRRRTQAARPREEQQRSIPS